MYQKIISKINTRCNYIVLLIVIIFITLFLIKKKNIPGSLLIAKQINKEPYLIGKSFGKSMNKILTDENYVEIMCKFIKYVNLIKRKSIYICAGEAISMNRINIFSTCFIRLLNNKQKKILLNITINVLTNKQLRYIGTNTNNHIITNIIKSTSNKNLKNLLRETISELSKKSINILIKTIINVYSVDELTEIIGNYMLSMCQY